MMKVIKRGNSFSLRKETTGYGADWRDEAWVEMDGRGRRDIFLYARLIFVGISELRTSGCSVLNVEVDIRRKYENSSVFPKRYISHNIQFRYVRKSFIREYVINSLNGFE